MTEESEYIAKEPCPECGSRDNLARYSDGHGYCFGCHYYEHGDGTPQEERRVSPKSKDLIPLGEAQDLRSRGLTEETCAKLGYTVSRYRGEPVQVANHKDEMGRVIAQKVRTKDKDFFFLGDTKELGFWGQHLWRDGGRKVVITEGEIDMASVSQCQGNKWPVVSLTRGAAGAKKDFQRNIKWLSKFDEVVLWFDDDEAGRTAVEVAATILPPGRCKVTWAKGEHKDANDMLRAGMVKEIIDCVWSAKEYRPDGIVSVEDIMEEALTPPEMGLSWWMQELTDLTYGRRWGEVYGFGAGTGVGKTDWFMQQLAHDVNVLDLKVGAIFLEQKPSETAKRAAGKFACKQFHVPDAGWDQDDLRDALECMKDRVYLYDNWGQTDWDVVREHIRFMTHSLGIRVFYLDHLTALADEGDSERASLEKITKQMAMLANELKIIIHFISHLTTPDGKPHEEGGRVMIRHFKGSRSIGFWSFFMFGLERDQQSDNEDIRSTTVFRVLKDRYTGRSTGQTILLGYHQDEGRLYVRDDDPFADAETSASGGFQVEDTSDITDDAPF